MMPVFDDPNDDAARKALQEPLPRAPRCVTVPGREIVLSGGGRECTASPNSSRAARGPA